MDENGEYLPGIDDYSAAIRELLEEAVPEIPWNEEVKGPALSNETEGTIAADKVTFSGQDKEDEEGVITFMIYIVVPDQTENRLETLSRKVRKVLNEADFMDGHVASITFGIAQGQRGRNPGTAVLEYLVKACM